MVLKKRREAEIKAKILKTLLFVKPKPTKLKQRKRLKSGEITTYTRTDYYIRLPAAMKGGEGRPIAVLRWEDIENLITIKAMYQLTDDELTWILLKLFEQSW